MDEHVGRLANVDRLGDGVVRSDLGRVLHVPRAGLEVVGRQVRDDLLQRDVFQHGHRQERLENLVLHRRLGYGWLFGEHVGHQGGVPFALDQVHHGRLGGRGPERGELAGRILRDHLRTVQSVRAETILNNIQGREWGVGRV